MEGLSHGHLDNILRLIYSYEFKMFTKIDVGASLTHQVSQHMEQERQLDSASTYNFESPWEVLRLSFMKPFINKRTCIVS
jgi:glutathione peroxidase-family protein